MNATMVAPPHALRHTLLHRHRTLLFEQKSSSRRSISLLHNLLTSNAKGQQHDLDSAIATVQQYDPAGYWPGRLLPEQQMSLAYYAVRSFWVETGLRFGSTARVPPNSTPLEHLEWWQQGIDKVFDETTADAAKDEDEVQKLLPPEWTHPTLRLLQSIIRKKTPWKREHFDNILAGRRKDLDVKQYDTLRDLVRHAELSCGNLLQLVLESGDITAEHNPVSHEAARCVGVCHGLTNALRTSIPVISTTGKLIIPTELTLKYNIKSPRYLLSALGQGDDEECVAALQHAVQDIVNEGRKYLHMARELRSDVLQEPGGIKAVAVLLPGLASEAFLNRLEAYHFQLTNRDLRNVGTAEQFAITAGMIAAYYRKVY